MSAAANTSALRCYVLTQRVTDWFDSRIGRTIQGVAASKWFGQMEARKLYEIAPSLGISPEERDRIIKDLFCTVAITWVDVQFDTHLPIFVECDSVVTPDAAGAMKGQPMLWLGCAGCGLLKERTPVTY
jgi:hypothetical protein